MQSIKREELEWLISLPFEKDVIIDNISMKLCHGAPGKPDYYIYPDLEQTTFWNFAMMHMILFLLVIHSIHLFLIMVIVH